MVYNGALNVVVKGGKLQAQLMFGNTNTAEKPMRIQGMLGSQRCHIKWGWTELWKAVNHEPMISIEGTILVLWENQIECKRSEVKHAEN